MIKIMPFPVASVVREKNTGRQYLVEQVGVRYQPDYSLVGHKALGSEGFGCAWEDHDDYELLSEPTLESWSLLIEAVSEDCDEDEDGE